MIAVIDDQRASYGAEPICWILPIAPSTYHAHVAQRVDATKSSLEEIRRVDRENFEVHGVRKVWLQRWLGKFGQADEWISCLTAAKLPRIRREHDEANAPDA